MPLVTGALKPVEQAAQAQPGLGAINENGGVLVGHEQGRYEAISLLPDVARAAGDRRDSTCCRGMTVSGRSGEETALIGQSPHRRPR